MNNRVDIVKRNGFWYLVDMKASKFIAQSNKDGKVVPVRAKTFDKASALAQKWETFFARIGK